LHLNDVEERRLRNNLRKVAITAAEVIAIQFPCREYGIDFGLKPTGKPMIYEVNTTPGIDGFSQIEYNTLWERIVKIRKLQRKG